LNRLYRGSLALRVLGISVLAIALPLFLYFLFVYHESYSRRLRDIVVRLTDLGQSRAQLVGQLNTYDLRMIDVIEELMHNYKGTGWERDQWLSGVLRSVAEGGNFAAAYYISIESDGTFIATAASDSELIGHDYSADQYVEQVMMKGHASFLAYGSSVSAGTDSFEKYFYVAKLVYDPETYRPAGILTLSTAVNDLVSRLVAPEDEIYAVDFSLLTSGGMVFASGDPDLVLRTVTPVGKRELREFERIRGIAPGAVQLSGIEIEPIKSVPNSMYLTWNGKEHIGVEVPIKGTDLGLLLTANETTVFQEQRDRLLQVLGLFILIFAAGCWAALWLTQQMSRPLGQLCEVMNRVSRGDLTARYKKQRMGFEINIIGNIFNDSINSLREQMARAEAERVEKETLDQEFRIGRDIQLSILPQAELDFPGVDVSARYLPAKQVGGDFYDMFVKPRPNGEVNDLVLTVADASGKGISACLYALLLRSMLRSFAVTQTTVSETMRQANNLFCQDTGMSGMFVTAFTAVFHPDTNQLTYTSCGHTPGIVRRADGAIESLVGKGMAMGVLPTNELEEDSIQLHKGDLLVLYSDGITEAHNERNELFGEERVHTFVREQGNQALDAIADGLLAEIATFHGEAVQYDDITLLIMRL
jgi:sigma-B regulation protein RsbU (phosphoserine phosphatase)